MSEMDEKGQHVTLKELKANLRSNLKKSGVLNTVKAHIRKEFIANMYPSGKKTLRPGSSTRPLFERALFSSIYHCFKARGMTSSLSVFAAESGIENQSPLSELDIVQALQFGTQSGLYRAVKEKSEGGFDENKLAGAKSVLEMMIQEGVGKVRAGSCDAMVQTDQGQSVRDFLVEKNMELHNKYMAQLEEERKLPVRSIEERMITFERECEERFRRDLDAQVTHIRATEHQKVREEERSLARGELDRLRRDLEAEYTQRLALYSQREQEITTTACRREQEVEKELYESRQQLLKGMEESRMRDEAAAKKLELESQGLRILEARVMEAKEFADIRCSH